MFLVQYYDHYKSQTCSESFHSYNSLKAWLDSVGKKYWDGDKMMIGSIMLFKHMGELVAPSPIIDYSTGEGKLYFPPASLDGTEASRSNKRAEEGPTWSLPGVS